MLLVDGYRVCERGCGRLIGVGHDEIAEFRRHGLEVQLRSVEAISKRWHRYEVLSQLG